MYLIQTDAASQMGTLLIGALVSLIILYYIIKDAVRSGTKEMRQQLALQNNLKMQEMKKSGHTDDELKTAMSKALIK